jgi:hypothetical protein
LAKGASITEIEIREGVLRADEQVNAYFYFRSPQMETAAGFREEPGSREAGKLSALKNTLRGQKDSRYAFSRAALTSGGAPGLTVSV